MAPNEACEQIPGLVACTVALEIIFARVDAGLSAGRIFFMCGYNLHDFVLVQFVGVWYSRFLHHTPGVALRWWLGMWVCLDNLDMIIRYTFRFSFGSISSKFIWCNFFILSGVMENSLAHSTFILINSELSARTTLPPINVHTATQMMNFVILIALLSWRTLRNWHRTAGLPMLIIRLYSCWPTFWNFLLY